MASNLLKALTLIVFTNFIFTEEHNMLGYWLTSGSIVKIEECDGMLCGKIEHVFVEEGVDPKSVLDSNNKDDSLKSRPLIGVNLFVNFPYSDTNTMKLKNGKIYDPGRGKIFKSNLYVLESGNLKVEGCLLGICGHEEWQPLKVVINKDGTRSAELLD